MSCQTVFTTREKPDYGESVRVKDILGNLEPFSSERLLFSVHNCLSHRKNAHSESGGIVDTVISKTIPSQLVRGVLDIKDLAITASEVLNNFDPASNTFYRAHHKRYFD